MDEIITNQRHASTDFDDHDIDDDPISNKNNIVIFSTDQSDSLHPMKNRKFITDKSYENLSISTNYSFFDISSVVNDSSGNDSINMNIKLINLTQPDSDDSDSLSTNSFSIEQTPVNTIQRDISNCSESFKIFSHLSHFHLFIIKLIPYAIN